MPLVPAEKRSLALERNEGTGLFFSLRRLVSGRMADALERTGKNRAPWKSGENVQEVGPFQAAVYLLEYERGVAAQLPALSR